MRGCIPLFPRDNQNAEEKLIGEQVVVRIKRGANVWSRLLTSFAADASHHCPFSGGQLIGSGKRLRVILSDNNAGIDDALLGGVVDRKYDAYRLIDQWTSYGWNVFAVEDGNNYDQVVAAMKTLEDWDPADRRPMIVIAKTIKGYWPAASAGKLPDECDQIIGYKSHPYALKMNSEYFLPLARTFEKRYGVEFDGIRQGPVKDPRERLVQFKTNIDIVMSLLDRNGLGDWLADRLVTIGDTLRDDVPLRLQVTSDPFQDDRLAVASLPLEPQKIAVETLPASWIAAFRRVPSGLLSGS